MAEKRQDSGFTVTDRRLFTEDGEFTILGRQRENKTVGRANLLKSYKEGLASLTPRPYIHNHVIDLKGNAQASGRCYVELRNASDNMAWLGPGFYNDEYVKVGDQWKFKARRFQQTHMENRQAKSPAQQ